MNELRELLRHIKRCESERTLQRVANRTIEYLRRNFDENVDVKFYLREAHRPVEIEGSGDCTGKPYEFPMNSESGTRGRIEVYSEEEIRDELKDHIGIVADEFAQAVQRLERIDQLKRKDLTGAFTRSYTQDELIPELRNSGDDFAVIQFDIDDFSSVNNQYSHEFGSRVLAALSERLKKSLNEIDSRTYLCKAGGDEFYVLVTEVTVDESIEIAEDVLGEARGMSETHPESGDEISITLSVGVAHFPTDADHIEELIEKADNACYKSKALGKNTVEPAKNIISDAISKHQISKEFKNKLGDLYIDYELHSITREFDIDDDGVAEFDGTRTVTQKTETADGFPIILTSEGEISNTRSKNVEITYAVNDHSSAYVYALAIPEFRQEVGRQIDVNFACSLGEAYPGQTEYHQTELSLSDPPIHIEDTFRFQGERMPRKAHVQEYSREQEQWVEMNAGSCDQRDVTLDADDQVVHSRVEITETPIIIRTVWEH
jgi:diguanylate cyclase (GGDEF)-like protein